MNRSEISKGKEMSYRQITGPSGALATLTPFVHGDSMAGGWDETETTYYVFSYQTVIAWVNVWHEWQFNAQRYSVTTSKQQTYTRAWLASNTVKAFGVDFRESGYFSGAGIDAAKEI